MFHPQRNLARATTLAMTLVFCAAGSLPAASPHTGKHCVWRATNSPVPFYLAGSMHALSGRDLPLPDCYYQALNDVQLVLFEYDPSTEHKFANDFRKAAEYPDGDSLNGKVHKETYDFLMKACRRSNIPFDEMKKYRPWAIAFYIWGVRGFNDVFSKYGVEKALQHKCKMAGKQMGGLVPMKEHIAVMSEMPNIDQEILLLNAMVRGDKRRQDFEQMREAWRRGDMATLWAVSQQSEKTSASLDARLLTDRNRKWIPRIEGEIKAGKPTMVVAGALHFAGPNNVLSLLQERGYKFEQL